jgi:hypothetical protein
MTRQPWLAVVLLSVFGSGPADAQRPASQPAESAACGSGSVCGEFDRHPVVFVGTVTQASPEADDHALGPLRPQIVNFQVIEDFKGASGSSTTLQFDPAAANARVFSSGETVLVYALRSGTLSFAGCSRTRRVTLDDPELVTLRQLHALIPGGSIEGTLELPADPRPPAAPRNADLANLQLTAQALDGSGIMSISSQAGGSFLFPWLRPGEYRVRFVSPLFVPIVRDVVVTETTRCLTLPPIAVRPR